MAPVIIHQHRLEDLTHSLTTPCTRVSCSGSKRPLSRTSHSTCTMLLMAHPDCCHRALSPHQEMRSSETKSNQKITQFSRHRVYHSLPGTCCGTHTQVKRFTQLLHSAVQQVAAILEPFQTGALDLCVPLHRWK